MDNPCLHRRRCRQTFRYRQSIVARLHRRLSLCFPPTEITDYFRFRSQKPKPMNISPPQRPDVNRTPVYWSQVRTTRHLGGRCGDRFELRNYQILCHDICFRQHLLRPPLCQGAIVVLGFGKFGNYLFGLTHRQGHQIAQKRQGLPGAEW